MPHSAPLDFHEFFNAPANSAGSAGSAGSTGYAGSARELLLRAVDLALDEDGRDLATNAVFAPDARMSARITAKSPCVLAGLPLVEIVLARTIERFSPESSGGFHVEHLAADGERAEPGRIVTRIEAPTRALLKAERVILNFLMRLSGIATFTAEHVAALHALGPTRTKLLDTRKTLPGLRWPDKYAVRAGGGFNHRMNLEEMLMLKDNHVDGLGGDVVRAVRRLRESLAPCPPIEIECRSLAEVDAAVAAGVNRIMLDNMDAESMRVCLARVPDGVETEISGNVTLERLPLLGTLGADFVSVGRITHSAPAADLSLKAIR